jgi:hypothetical protein
MVFNWIARLHADMQKEKNLFRDVVSSGVKKQFESGLSYTGRVIR